MSLQKKAANAGSTLRPCAGIRSKCEYEQSATQVLIEFFFSFFLALTLRPVDEGTRKVSMIPEFPSSATTIMIMSETSPLFSGRP